MLDIVGILLAAATIVWAVRAQRRNRGRVALINESDRRILLFGLFVALAIGALVTATTLLLALVLHAPAWPHIPLALGWMSVVAVAGTIALGPRLNGSLAIGWLTFVDARAIRIDLGDGRYDITLGPDTTRVFAGPGGEHAVIRVRDAAGAWLQLCVRPGVRGWLALGQLEMADRLTGLLVAGETQRLIRMVVANRAERAPG